MELKAPISPALYRSKLQTSLKLLAGYAAWVISFRLLILTLTTYFMAAPSSLGGKIPRFDEVSEAFSSSGLSWMGIGIILYLLLLRGLKPTEPLSLAEVLGSPASPRKFRVGALIGACLAAALAFAFVGTGVYRFLGIYIQFADAPLTAAAVGIRILAIAAFIYGEEYLFRKRLWEASDIPDAGVSYTLSVATLTALAYAMIKWFQFDLSYMHWLSLFLLSLDLSVRRLNEGEYATGAGIWAGVLIVLQPILSIPVFGSDFTGIWLLKPIPVMDTINRLFSGGAGGPISGFAFQIILLTDIWRGIQKLRLPRKSV